MAVMVNMVRPSVISMVEWLDSFTFYWLVVFRQPSEKYESVNWDDEIPQYFWENKIDGNQTTNQFTFYVIKK